MVFTAKDRVSAELVTLCDAVRNKIQQMTIGAWKVEALPVDEGRGKMLLTHTVLHRNEELTWICEHTYSYYMLRDSRIDLAESIVLSTMMRLFQFTDA